MVEIFKTNIRVEQSEKIIRELLKIYPETEISIDAEDCDKVLRIVSGCITIKEIQEIVHENGYECEPLLD